MSPTKFLVDKKFNSQSHMMAAAIQLTSHCRRQDIPCSVVPRTTMAEYCYGAERDHALTETWELEIEFLPYLGHPVERAVAIGKPLVEAEGFRLKPMPVEQLVVS